MRLEQREKELAAIGASIGANCRPCIKHHIPAGREAGLSEVELDDAVATAQAVRSEAVALLSARIDTLFGHRGAAPEPAPVVRVSKARELVALGATVGATRTLCCNSTSGPPPDVGLTSPHVEAAVKMARYVQQHAVDMTAENANTVLEELRRASAGAAGR